MKAVQHRLTRLELAIGRLPANLAAQLAAGVRVEDLSDDELLTIVRSGGGPDVERMSDEELRRIVEEGAADGESNV